MFKIFLKNELMPLDESAFQFYQQEFFFIVLIFSYKERHSVHITLVNKIMRVETITILHFDLLKSSIVYYLSYF